MVLNYGPGRYHPALQSECLVHYQLELIDGSVVDTTYKTKEPQRFSPINMIPAWTEALQWSGAADFARAENQTWTLASGADAGSFKSASGLTFLKVRDAGHLVPHDQPAASLEMVVRHFNDGF